jgi:DNA-binding transcriptional LysR family regulator
MLEVRRLRLLRELAARGTIAATAEACSLTPSAVSQQLAALEREAGAPLLIRDGRRLVLTEAAQVLVGHTERILAELEEAQASVAGLAGEVRGVLRLAAFPTAASSLVPSAIATCRADHPDLRVLLDDLETGEALSALKAGRIDVALVYEYNLLPDRADPGIRLVPLVREKLLLVLPTSMKADDPLTLGALRHESWVAPDSDTALRTALWRACGLAGFEPRLHYTSDDYTVMLALVQAGLGVALVPQLALASVAADLQIREVTDLLLTRTVSAAIRAGTRANPAVAAVINALQAAAVGLRLTR